MNETDLIIRALGTHAARLQAAARTRAYTGPLHAETRARMRAEATQAIHLADLLRMGRRGLVTAQGG